MAEIHKDQRVGVFVDVQNMYYSAKNLYNSKVDFKKVLDAAVMNRRLIRASAYVIKGETPGEENFFEALSKIGYEVK
ncbi:MAG: NYN domain-containing protein, partial [Candidatus Nanohaloarchaea archaeon]